jgi:hypothetical protein
MPRVEAIQRQPNRSEQATPAMQIILWCCLINDLSVVHVEASSVNARTPREPTQMRRTPLLPEHFRDWKPSRCPHGHVGCLASKNVYEIRGLESERKLFGSERMVDSQGRDVVGRQYKGADVTWEFGDWDCEAFLVMQDAAPWDKIAERVGHHPDPFSARNFIDEPRAGGAASNRELVRFSAPLRCRKLAGSALIGVLRPGNNYSGPIPDLLQCDWVRKHCADVLHWVTHESQTPNLRVVACLGVAALDFITQSLHICPQDKAALENNRGCTVRSGRFRISYLWHPQPQAWSSVGRSTAEAAWRRMAAEAGIPYQQKRT